LILTAERSPALSASTAILSAPVSEAKTYFQYRCILLLPRLLIKRNCRPGILHPRRIYEGVREGVEHGGNKSGIPTVNGSIVFDERYLGKPLVYCGTAGIMPAKLNGKPTHGKEIKSDDVIIHDRRPYRQRRHPRRQRFHPKSYMKDHL